MKKLSKLMVILITGLMFSINVSAQLTATASANAVIYSALTITRTADLDFGVIIPSAAAGNVSIAADGTVTRLNNTAHPSSTESRARFHVVGEPLGTYAITVTAPLPITLTSGGNTMTVTALPRTPAADGALDGTGVQDIYLGGTLQVGANQAAGTYTNATAITIDINYN